MSASRTKKERQAQLEGGLSPKLKKEQEAARKSRRNAIIYTIIGGVVVLAVAALLFWDSGVIQKHSTALTVGDMEYGVVDLDYYYYSAYSTYYSYASLYGLDTDEDLDEQEVYDGYTWDDMLKDSAVSTLTNVSVLYQEALAEGYELSEDSQTTITQSVNSIATYAALYGVTESYYLQSSYGKYMTIDDYERIYTEYLTAVEYAEYKTESFEVTDEEIDEYYEENTISLDTIDYTCYRVKFDTTEEDDDGNTVDLDEDALEANRAEAEAEAQEILDALVAGDADTAAELAETYGASDYSNYTISYYDFADWMSDTSNQAGSYSLIEYVSSTDEDEVLGYYAVYINERYLDEYYGADVRVITLTADEDDDGEYDMDALQEEMDAVIEEYEATDMTEDDFTDLADSYSEDASTYSGGLRENLSKSTFNDEINEWIFSDERVFGDYECFTDEDSSAMYLIYYVGQQDTLYWKSVCIEDLQSEKYSDWLDEATETYGYETGLGLRFVG